MKTNKANQVAAFEKLLSYCNAQSAVYKPSKVSIQLAALNTLLTQSLQSMKAADVSRTAYENAINARQPVFRNLPRLVSRIVDALIASGASAEMVADAKAIRRLFGNPARILVPERPANAPEGTEPRKRSYKDMASQIENFEKLVNRIAAEPLYKPAEVDLAVSALITHAALLRTLNRNVINAHVALKNANGALNLLLYTSTGIYGTASMVKAYMRSVFGRNTTHYHELAMLQFKNK